MFTDIKIDSEYRPGKNNVVKDFFIPTLLNAVKYKRAVGFFSSTALIEISKGIMGLIKNNGTIDLIVSPRLSEEDIEAMEIGYTKRDEIIENAIMRGFEEPKNYFEEERLNILANLIAEGKLNIKVAFTTNHNQLGIYHEKMGLMYDLNDNVIAFSGSTNETETAFISNYEVLDVFCSWQSEFELKKVKEKETAFYSLWNNEDSSVIIMDFPNVAKEKLQQYKKDKIDPNIDNKEIDEKKEIYYTADTMKNVFLKPKNINLYKYQKDAIENWINSKACGIFDMATGTGKTYTALSALAFLSEKLNNNLGVVILCPYQHLIEQWVEDIKNFNVEPLICYSKYNWKEKFKYLIQDYNLDIIERFCVIMSNDSYATDYVQNILREGKGNLCLVVDEAHNLGAEKQLSCMLENFKYRLGLSATIERHHDKEGTQKLIDYFGEKCIEFSLKQAIDENFLAHYYYKPVVVYLDDDELEKYNDITKKIINIIKMNDFEIGNLPKNVEMLLIKRARIIAGARQKVPKLKEIIYSYRNDNNILVYCGATKYDGEMENEDVRQIEAVTNMLGNELNMRVSMFTSKEGPEERERIKNSFAEGEMLQAIVAIKCLDEGVNIPGIKTAFILASSTNPKEYIQRRGRVLRQSSNKKFATIYDFVTLPKPLDEPLSGDIESEMSLLRREIERMEDFMAYCDNQSETISLIDKIKGHYKYYEIGVKDYGI